MKKVSALLLIIVLSFSVCYAATTITKTKTTITNKKPIFGSTHSTTESTGKKAVFTGKKTGPLVNKTVVKKVPITRYYYPKTTVAVAKKTVNYQPWKWLGTVKVVVNRAVMVAQPDRGAALVANLKMGSECQVQRRTESWFYIQADGREGWVHKDSVKVTKIVKDVKPSSGENLQEETVNEKGNVNEKGK